MLIPCHLLPCEHTFTTRVSRTWWRVVESCPGNAQQGKLSWILAPQGQGQNDGKAFVCMKITTCCWLWGRRVEGEQSLCPLLCCCPFSLPAPPPGPFSCESDCHLHPSAAPDVCLPDSRAQKLTPSAACALKGSWGRQISPLSHNVPRLLRGQHSKALALIFLHCHHLPWN